MAILLAIPLFVSAPARPVPKSDVSFFSPPHFEVFSEREGLPQASVQSLALTPGGELWVGTQDGLALFDGHRFREVLLPERHVSNWINAILPARDGDLFFATDAGVHRLRRQAGSETWVPFREKPAGWSGLVVKALAEDPQSVVAGTREGLLRFLGETWQPLTARDLPPNLDVNRLAVGADGALWIGHEKGLGRLRDGVYESQPIFAGRPVTALYIDAETVLAGGEGAAYRFDFGSSRATWLPLADPAAMADLSLRSFARQSGSQEGSQEVIWAGSSRGLSLLADGRVQHYSFEEGLPGGSLEALLLAPGDRSDLLFLGTGNEGLARGHLNGWVPFDTRNSALPRNDVYAMAEIGPAEDPAYLFATEAGLLVWRGERSGLLNQANSALPNDFINALLEKRDGTVLIGTDSGLLEVPPGSLGDLGLAGARRLDSGSPLPSPAVISLLEARDGALLVGTREGLARSRPDGGWDISLKGHQIYVLAEIEIGGRPQIWAGTRRGGLAREVAPGQWEHFDPANSALPNVWVNCLEPVPSAAGPRLWVGTDGGAVLLDPAHPKEPWLLLQEKSEPALPNQVVFQIRRDAAGRLHFFTNRGIARSLASGSSQSSLPGENLRFEVFTMADGLPANGFLQWSSLIDRQGRLWAGTVRGLIRYDPLFESRRLPPIAKLRLTTVEISGQSALGAGPLALAWNDHLLVRYELPRLAGGEKTVFRTRLDALETEPNFSPTGERFFSHLPAGIYTLEIAATDGLGRPAAPLALSIEVAHAPWRSPWAFALYGVALVGGSVLLMRLREAAQRAREARLEALVVERTASLELAREEAVEASRVKGRFLANMSHELRTPLNGVIGLTNLLEKTELDPTQRRYLENLRMSGQHLLALVGDVLDFEKIAAGQLELDNEAVQLNPFLRSCLAVVRPEAENKGVELVCTLAADLPPWVEADARRLRQVLLNLLSNAVKFTPRGQIELAASVAASFGERLEIRVRVHDSGIGIPEERRDRLFKPFSQVDSSTTRLYGGTGLGLAICKALVEKMGGSIGVESAVGQGSVFEFTFLAQKLPDDYQLETEAGSGHFPLHQSRHRIRRVLLAEDQHINQIVARAMFESLGCKVELTDNGRQAVDSASAESFDLIVLDLQMPELDGLGAAQEIADNLGRDCPPIVLLTADARPETRAASLRAGIAEFLTKPIQQEDLVALLGRLESGPEFIR